MGFFYTIIFTFVFENVCLKGFPGSLLGKQTFAKSSFVSFLTLKYIL